MNLWNILQLADDFLVMEPQQLEFLGRFFIVLLRRLKLTKHLWYSRNAIGNINKRRSMPATDFCKTRFMACYRTVAVVIRAV